MYGVKTLAFEILHSKSKLSKQIRRFIHAVHTPASELYKQNSIHKSPDLQPKHSQTKLNKEAKLNKLSILVLLETNLLRDIFMRCFVEFPAIITPSWRLSLMLNIRLCELMDFCKIWRIKDVGQPSERGRLNWSEFTSTNKTFFSHFSRDNS